MRMLQIRAHPQARQDKTRTERATCVSCRSPAEAEDAPANPDYRCPQKNRGCDRRLQLTNWCVSSLNDREKSMLYFDSCRIVQPLGGYYRPDAIHLLQPWPRPCNQTRSGQTLKPNSPMAA